MTAPRPTSIEHQPAARPGFTNTWSSISGPAAAAYEMTGTLIFLPTRRIPVTPACTHQKDPKTGYGVRPLMVARDMGKIGRKMEWKLIFGASLTDIQFAHVRRTLIARRSPRTTDTYVPNLNGAAGPADDAALQAGTFTGSKWYRQVDADGNPILDSTGAQSH